MVAAGGCRGLQRWGFYLIAQDKWPSGGKGWLRAPGEDVSRGNIEISGWRCLLLKLARTWGIGDSGEGDWRGIGGG